MSPLGKFTLALLGLRFFGAEGFFYRPVSGAYADRPHIGYYRFGKAFEFVG